MICREPSCAAAVVLQETANAPSSTHTKKLTSFFILAPFIEVSPTWKSLIRDKPMGFGGNSIYRSSRCNVKRGITCVTPRKVRRLLRHHDRSQVLTCRAPYPNAARPNHIKISIRVDAHSVRNTVFFRRLLRSEDPAIGYGPVRMKVVDTNVEVLIVIYIQLFPVGRKRQTIRLANFLCKQGDLAVLSYTIDSLKRSFLLLSFRQVRGGIGDINRSVWPKHHIIRRVKPLAAIPIRNNCVALAVRRKTNHRPQHARAIQNPSMPVIGVSVRIPQSNHFLLLPALYIDLENLVQRLIADIQETGLIPDRPLGEAESGRNGSQICTVIYQFPELRRETLQFKLSLWHLRAGCGAKHRPQECGYACYHQQSCS